VGNLGMVLPGIKFEILPHISPYVYIYVYIYMYNICIIYV
jgi:hypothetical protein